LLSPRHRQPRPLRWPWAETFLHHHHASSPVSRGGRGRCGAGVALIHGPALSSLSSSTLLSCQPLIFSFSLCRVLCIFLPSQIF
jgi:hypothetical protein